MADKQHLYLVDGSAYIFRAYHRLPPLTDPHGVPVGAVYGYTTMLWKLADDLDKADGPTHLAVILDKGSTSFRNALYDQYKANRPPPPEDLVPQFPLIRDATRAFSLPCIEEDDLEADDLIASYAKEATRRGWDVTIVSSDKDLMQLVGKCAEPNGGVEGGCIDMLDTMKNQRIDIPEVVEKFGVPPELVGDVLALMGDSVDNVPGIFGIGPKTASKLIQDYGSLQGALDAAPSMKPGKLRDRLIEGREMAELSRVLVQLKDDCPLPVPLDDFVLKPVFLDARQREGAGGIADQWELRDQVFRRLGPIRLVLVVEIVAEAVAALVENHREVRRPVRLVQVFSQLPQHRGVAVDRADRRALRVGQRRQAVIGAENVGRSVDQVEMLLVGHGGLVASGRR